MAVRVRVFRRWGTWAFGIVTLLVAGAIGISAVTTGTLSLRDRLTVCLVVGTLAFVMFRSGVWPAVLIADDKIVVRNPVTVTTIGPGRVSLGRKMGWSPWLEVGEGKINLFCYSSSMIAEVTGNRSFNTFAEALRARPSSTANASVAIDRHSVLLQFAAMHVVLAGFAILVDVLVGVPR